MPKPYVLLAQALRSDRASGGQRDEVAGGANPMANRNKRPLRRISIPSRGCTRKRYEHEAGGAQSVYRKPSGMHRDLRSELKSRAMRSRRGLRCAGALPQIGLLGVFRAGGERRADGCVFFTPLAQSGTLRARPSAFGTSQPRR